VERAAASQRQLAQIEERLAAPLLRYLVPQDQSSHGDDHLEIEEIRSVQVLGPEPGTSATVVQQSLDEH